MLYELLLRVVDQLLLLRVGVNATARRRKTIRHLTSGARRSSIPIKLLLNLPAILPLISIRTQKWQLKLVIIAHFETLLLIWRLVLRTTFHLNFITLSNLRLIYGRII